MSEIKFIKSCQSVDIYVNTLMYITECLYFNLIKNCHEKKITSDPQLNQYYHVLIGKNQFYYSVLKAQKSYPTKLTDPFRKVSVRNY